MADKYSTIQQHQPLRIPTGWDKQERALIVQLDEVFDDIYRRFGRLSLNDFNKETRKSFADIEGNFTEIRADIAGLEVDVGNAQGDISQLQQDAVSLTARVTDAEGDIGALEIRAGNIELSVQGKYDIRSGIDINAAGIDITGGKYIKIKSGSDNIIDLSADGMKLGSGGNLYLYTGATFTLQSDNFKVDNQGNVTLKGDVEIGNGKQATITGTGKLVLQDNSTSLIEIGGSGVAVKTGGTFTVQSQKFGIDANGDVTIKGDLTGSTGRFDGTLSANTVSGLTLTGSQIVGGTLSLGGNNNGNGELKVYNASNVLVGRWDCDGIWLDAGSIDAQHVTITNIDASKINTGRLDCSNLTVVNLSASAIKGGTLSLGGANNGNGELKVYNASNVLVGRWDCDGIWLNSGSIDARNVTISHIDASQIDTGNLNAGIIQGGTLRLGGSNNNQYGTLSILNSLNQEIGTWDSSGINATGSLTATNWKFDSEGATYSKKINNVTRKMRVGEMTYGSSQPADAGLYFSMDTNNATAELTLATNYLGAAAGRVVLSGTGINASALYQLGGVSLGNSDHKWVDYFGMNLLSPGNMMSFYPRRTSATGARWYMEYDQYNGYQYFGSDGAVESYIGQASALITYGWFKNLWWDTPLNSSSREVKHDIKALPEQGDMIDRLQPVSYVYNSDKNNRKRFGLIWEDTAEVLPEICLVEDGQKGINYMDLIPVLLKEVQGLRKRVKDLEERCRQCTM